jgi:hypothetical protein
MSSGWPTAAPPLLAHVLTPAGNHLVLLWPASAILAAGFVLAVVTRNRAWRRRGTALAGVGLVFAVTVYVVEPSYVAPPPYAIRLVAATAPGDIAVQVCLAAPSGGASAILGPGDLIDVFVDGVVHAEGPSTRFLIAIAPGRHSVDAEMVQHDHVAFFPAEVTPTVSVTVPPGVGGTLPATGC